MADLPLNMEQVLRVKKLAQNIADDTQKLIDIHSSVSTERTILRLIGVDGCVDGELPLPNRIIDLLIEENILENGISKPFAAALLKSGRNAQTTAELIHQKEIKLGDYSGLSPKDIQSKELDLAKIAIDLLETSKKNKLKKIAKYPLGPQPWKYLIVATGNIYEDRTQGISAAYAGADIVAVIRTTAQSLLDHVPYGPTTEGFGGTMATQENFKIMREALDKASNEQNRYVRLVNYSSGLCMAEIAACAAHEDLDMLLNDSMYGILFRDINPVRTFVDQYFSRLICAKADIIINTGEDNYLTTSDAIEQAYTVTSSQLINEAMAINAKLPEELMGLGHAYEIDPKQENAFLYEIAHAQLARQLFPKAPIKYMPPTKYKSTDIFFSHVMDTMFNMVSITTNQGIHLSGMPTEAIHTPLMMDRYQALSSINYVFNIAKDFGNEIEFKQDGFIANRATEVLNQSEKFLNEIVDGGGLLNAIEIGSFANVKRLRNEGKGKDGVFIKGSDYTNPIIDLLIN
ncbi:MAG: D-lysine 5,6-aminomutase subunit alpha [Candidatus Cloacimonadota bacterium]|nr:MAG: D-lysine 5,6-aminomutase subunit alpha [Candidatus Cloacimonadota bacterium]